MKSETAVVGEGGAGDLDLAASLLEPGDPEIARDGVGERVEEEDRPPLAPW